MTFLNINFVFILQVFDIASILSNRITFAVDNLFDFEKRWLRRFFEIFNRQN